MGVTGLVKFIEENWPEAVTVEHTKNLKFEGRLAVDGNNECYIHMHVAKVKVLATLTNERVDKCLRDRDERKKLREEITTQWIQRVLDFLLYDLKGKVVWVLDGKHVPVLKSKTREVRRERIDKQLREFQDYVEGLINEEFPNPVLSRKILTSYITSRPPDFSDITRLTNVLLRLNIPVIRAWGEGEKACSKLCLDGFMGCTGVWSTDVDSILFGCPVLYQRKRTMTEYEAGQEQTGMVKVVNPKLIKIPLDSLIKICISAGCDYFPEGIKGLGLKRSYKLELENKLEDVENGNIRKLFYHSDSEQNLPEVVTQDTDSNEGVENLVRMYKMLI